MRLDKLYHLLNFDDSRLQQTKLIEGLRENHFVFKNLSLNFGVSIIVKEIATKG